MPGERVTGMALAGPERAGSCQLLHKTRHMCGRECSRFDLEAVRPVAAAQRLEEIAEALV